VLFKQKIERAYNPAAYRQHLQNIFDIEMKTESMQKHLREVTSNVQRLEQENQKYERCLEKTASLTVLGRTHDSPSARKGPIQKRLREEKQIRADSHQRSGSAMHSSRMRSLSRPRSQNSIRHSVVDLDFSKIGSTAKNSQKTTDRSTYPRYLSDLSRPLF
jgi:hypothetical protein